MKECRRCPYCEQAEECIYSFKPDDEELSFFEELTILLKKLGKV